jgi:hypothetical protein
MNVSVNVKSSRKCPTFLLSRKGGTYIGLGNSNRLHLVFLFDLDLGLPFPLSLLAPGTSKQATALFLGASLTLEEPVAKEDFGSDLCRRRLVDISPAIRSEKDGLQGSRDASLT